jgi:hypothetical protein
MPPNFESARSVGERRFVGNEGGGETLELCGLGNRPREQERANLPRRNKKPENNPMHSSQAPAAHTDFTKWI